MRTFEEIFVALRNAQEAGATNDSPAPITQGEASAILNALAEVGRRVKLTERMLKAVTEISEASAVAAFVDANAQGVTCVAISRGKHKDRPVGKVLAKHLAAHFNVSLKERESIDPAP